MRKSTVLHQSFTDNNLKKIFLAQNRKGAFLEGSFFPNVKAYSHKLTRIKKKIKDHKSREPNPPLLCIRHSLTGFIK